MFLGLISYPLYLWHWPLLTFARVSEGEKLGAALIAGVLATSFVLAWMTWFLVERPLRYRVFRVELGGRPAVTCLVWGGVALGLAALLGGITLAKEGFDGRHDAFLAGEPQAAETELQWRTTQYRDTECLRTGNFADADFCRRSEGPLRAAVVGDSHANHLMPGFVKQFSAEGTGIIHVGDGGCPSVLELRVLSPKKKEAGKAGGRALGMTARVSNGFVTTANG